MGSAAHQQRMGPDFAEYHTVYPEESVEKSSGHHVSCKEKKEQKPKRHYLIRTKED